MKRRRWFLIVLLAVLAIGFWHAFTPAHTPAPQPAITNLTQQDFSEFKTAFNRDAENVRLVLLLSPT